MSAREHVLDLLACLDVPLGNAAFAQDFYCFFFDAFSFSDRFHRLEGEKRIDTVVNQVHHDVIARRYGFAQSTLTVADEILSVAEPNVRAMRKARNSHEIAET